ncbi:MAG: hypothetical protein H6945_02215 [Zoogloeaceae bacterium]|nr:hypothetical protein [Rhodocyclaceae bacterium]MCP5234542.1 hypothetical protein [Zoogloeaceae bacterium]
MNTKPIAWLALMAAMAAVLPPVQADDGVPPLPLYMLEQRGTLTRIDVARRMVWIDRKPYKVTDDTQAYVGSRRLDDLRQLPRGAEVAFMPGEGGALASLWIEREVPDPTGRRR